MKRLFSLAALLLCSLLTFAQFSGSGSGTENDPYLILNPIHLNQLRNYLNQSGVYFKLMADIDLTEFLEDENPTQGWQPVGSSSAAFKGILDGNGKSVSGLWMKRGNNDYVGLFGYTDGATIKDLEITATTIEGANNVGGISGYSANTTISGCSFIGSINGTSCVGGYVGGSGDYMNLTSNKASVTINCTGDNVGGFIGKNEAYNSLSITGCILRNGNIRGNNYIGGCCGAIIGTHDKVNSISNSFCYTDISGNNYVGGICGNSSNDKNIVCVNGCGYIGDIVASANVGGLIGYMKRTGGYGSARLISLQNSFVISNIKANGDYIGGLVGCDKGYFYSSVYIYVQTYNNNYFNGSVTGANYVGGLVGYKQYGEVISSYANSIVSGARYVGGLLGYNCQSTLKTSVANTIRITATIGDIGRVVGYNDGGTIGSLGSTDENKAYNRAIVIKQGVVQNITDNEQHGTSVSANTLKLKATYVAMGWDFTNTWAIQETECYPYMQWQTAPPIITSNLAANATAISGKCVDGGSVNLEVDGQKYQVSSSGHNWSVNVSPLQAGREVRISAEAEDKVASYNMIQTVSYIGNGTESDPYRVYTADDLTGVYHKGYYKLMNDIDLTSWINANSPVEGWVAIGREGSEMTQFDGDGHQITGLWANTTRDYMGLFSMFNNGTIKNLTVVTAPGKKVKGGNYTGILIGRNTNGTITDCDVVGDVEGTVNVGGLAGSTINNQLSNLSFNGTVSSSTASAFVGGLIGSSTGDVINRCRTEAAITTTGSSANIGGIAGLSQSTIAQCYTSGTLTANGETAHVGGISGTNQLDGVISNCYSSASLSSSYSAGGIASYNYSTIDKCLSIGNLFTRNYAAGIVGYNDGTAATTANCVALNNKIDIDYESQQTSQGGGYGQRIVGGIKNGAPAPEMNNYALKTMQVSVNDVAQKVYDDIMNGTGKTEEELMQQATFAALSWDFNATWGIQEGTGYPYLKWVANGYPVSQITMSTTLMVSAGNNATLTATILPVNASNKQLEWSSDNAAVATVDNGVVTAIAIGTANITATATDGSGVTAICKVTVTANKETAITELRAKVNEAQTLYDSSTEGDGIGQYPAGSRATLLSVINNVNSKISDTMEDATITECMTDIEAAIQTFKSRKITNSPDTDITQLDNIVYIERLEANAGSQVRLSVKMKNSVAVQGYQFDLYLPDGVTVSKDEDDFIMAELSTERTTTNKTNYFDSAITSDGALRVLCGSSKGYTFSGNDGEVAVITINISKDIEEGEHAIILKAIKLSDSEAQPYSTEYVKSTLAISTYTLGDVNADGSIDVADFIAIANHILGNTSDGFVEKAADVNEDNAIDVADFIGVANMILHSTSGSQHIAARRAPRKVASNVSAMENAIYVEPVTVAAGSQQVLSVRMKNAEAVAGFQFNMQLPDGITFATDDDDAPLAELSTERTTSRRTNYFDSAIQDDGTLIVLCGTTNKNAETDALYTFSGNDGEVARITINVPADYTAGEYPIIIKDAIISDPEASKTNLQKEIESTLTVESTDGRVLLAETATTKPETALNVDVRVQRTIKANQWSSIVLPFAMTNAQMKEAFGNDVELADFTGYEAEEDGEGNIVGITVNFANATAIEANHPYIIKVSEAIAEFTVDGVDVEPEDEPVVATVKRTRKQWSEMIGTYVAETEIPSKTLFLNSNKFYYSTGATKMKAFRAYFDFFDVLTDVDDNYEVKMFVDGAETKVEGLGVKDAAGNVYDLSGRRVSKAQRGVYIVNGKKVLVK